MIHTPDFHDGLFLGIDLRTESVGQVFLRDLDGRDGCLTLHFLTRLRCDDFREGNIILDVNIYHCDEPPIDHINWLYSIDGRQASTGYCLEQSARVKDGTATLVVLSASYGGVLAAMCETHEFVWKSA